MKPVIDADDAFAECEVLAESCARATAPTAYGDGYRAAAQQIAAAIRAKRDGHPPSELERDLRDAEVEARTFARVIDAAVCVAMDAREQSDALEAVRALVGAFFAADDLPPILRTTARATPASRPPAGRARTGQASVERTSRTSA